MSKDEFSLAHTVWNCKYHIVFAPNTERSLKADLKENGDEFNSVYNRLDKNLSTERNGRSFAIGFAKLTIIFTPNLRFNLKKVYYYSHSCQTMYLRER